MRQTTQQEAYENSERIGSDPWHILNRDNRNHRKKADLITRYTAATYGDRVCEVGCGDGLHARQFSESFDLTAVDLSGSLVQNCRERAPEATVVQADATALPFESNAFDAVVGAAILHHMSDAAAALDEWMRVAEKSVTLTEPNYLFPKDLLTAHVVPEERHKTQMAPWRLRQTLNSVADEWALRPAISTPPWPDSCEGLYDQIDAAVARVPGLRWLSQMVIIHIAC